MNSEVSVFGHALKANPQIMPWNGLLQHGNFIAGHDGAFFGLIREFALISHGYTIYNKLSVGEGGAHNSGKVAAFGMNARQGRSYNRALQYDNVIRPGTESGARNFFNQVQRIG